VRTVLIPGRRREGYSLIENPNVGVEYHQVVRDIIETINSKQFSGTLWGDQITGLLDVRIRRIKKPYCVSVREDEHGLRSTLTFNRRLFEKYDNDLGDRSYGMVNVILRGLCEHFAKSLMRVTRLEEESRREVLILRETAEDFLRRAWNLSKKSGSGMVKETHYQYHQRMTSRGWRPVFFTAMMSICGRCSETVELPKVHEQDATLAMYPYIIHHESLSVKREARPVRTRRTRLRPTGKEGVTIHLKTGKTRTEGVA